jgi:hypothetical protein
MRGPMLKHISPIILLLLLSLVSINAQIVDTAPVVAGPIAGQVYLQSDTEIHLAWSDVENEDGYEIEFEITDLLDQATSVTIYSGTNEIELTLDSISFYNHVQFTIGKYSLRVRGFTGSLPSTQPGPWSQTVEFRVNNALPHSSLPDLYPSGSPDGVIDSNDVLAFSSQWYQISSAAQFNPTADYDGSGRVDEKDLLDIIDIISNGPPTASLPKVNLTWPTDGSYYSLAGILGGHSDLLVQWNPVNGAFGYVVSVEYGYYKQQAGNYLTVVNEKFVPQPAGMPEKVSTCISSFVTVSSLYNIRVAAVDEYYIRSEWSDIHRVSISDAVTPTPTPVLENRTLDPVQLVFPTTDSTFQVSDLRFVPFRWTRATKNGVPLPDDDVEYQFMLGFEYPPDPNGIRMIPLQGGQIVSSTGISGIHQSKAQLYYWSVFAKQKSTGEYSPSMNDPDFVLLPPPGNFPNAAFHLVNDPLVPIPGNVALARNHLMRSPWNSAYKGYYDFFAFAFAWNDTPGPGKTFANLADMDNSGLVDKKDLITFDSLYRGGNLVFNHPKFPNPPVLKDPQDSISRPNNDVDVYFSWDPVPDAAMYQIVVFGPTSVEISGNIYVSDPRFWARSYIVLDEQREPVPWVQLSGGLMTLPGIIGEFKWKVRALDADGNSSLFSETRKINITDPFAGKAGK